MNGFLSGGVLGHILRFILFFLLFCSLFAVVSGRDTVYSFGSFLEFMSLAPVPSIEWIKDIDHSILVSLTFSKPLQAIVREIIIPLVNVPLYIAHGAVALLTYIRWIFLYLIA